VTIVYRDEKLSHLYARRFGCSMALLIINIADSNPTNNPSFDPSQQTRTVSGGLSPRIGACYLVSVVLKASSEIVALQPKILEDSASHVRRLASAKSNVYMYLTINVT